MSSQILISVQPAFPETSGREGKFARAAQRKPDGWVLTPEKFLSDSEYDRLLAHVRERRDAALLRGRIMAIRDAALIVTLAKTGLRIGEAVHLTWANIHLRSTDGRPPAVFVQRGKGGKARLVVIGEELRRELRAWRQAAEARDLSVADEAPVFPSQRGGPLTVSGGEKAVGQAMGRAGIPGRRNPHRLRHTYAARIYRATRDLRLVQKLLGHARADTSAIYAGLFDPDVREAVNKV